MRNITWKTIFRLLKNKFFLSFLAFTVWIVVFDQHNLIDRIKTKRHLKQLREDTTFYHNRLKNDRDLIEQLETNQQNLEKFAREQYLMKKPDEDVFVILKE